MIYVSFAIDWRRLVCIIITPTTDYILYRILYCWWWDVLIEFVVDRKNIIASKINCIVWKVRQTAIVGGGAADHHRCIAICSYVCRMYWCIDDRLWSCGKAVLQMIEKPCNCNMTRVVHLLYQSLPGTLPRESADGVVPTAIESYINDIVWLCLVVLLLQ